uniref:PH domain-containing protein n=1 Tax=Macrostomum lignano TaxID=282301 RepID=A0A1I8FV77_9PLAT
MNKALIPANPSILMQKAYLRAPSDQPTDKQAEVVARDQTEKQQQSQADAGIKAAGASQNQKITYVSGRDAVETKLLLGEFEEESLFEYLPVQVLERGMLFGFTYHFFENQPALKLISKGCELLCIRRELYFDNANEITLFNVGNTLRPYPSELAVLSKNKEVRAWTEVKAQQYDKTVTDMAKEAVDVHDALTRFPPIAAAKHAPQRYLK